MDIATDISFPMHLKRNTAYPQLNIGKTTDKNNPTAFKQWGVDFLFDFSVVISDKWRLDSLFGKYTVLPRTTVSIAMDFFISIFPYC